jgi:diadenylate cyclase
MVRHAHAIAREVGARVIMLHADVVEEDADLSSLIEDVDFRIILVSRRASIRRWNVPTCARSCMSRTSP